MEKKNILFSIFGFILLFFQVSCDQQFLFTSKQPKLNFKSIEVLPFAKSFGSWQTIRLTIENKGDDFKGNLIGYQVEPRPGGTSTQAEGESYHLPIEIAKGTTKALELKIPGRNWQAMGLTLKVGDGEYELKKLFFDLFGKDYIPMPHPQYNSKLAWVLSRPSSSKGEIFKTLRKMKYDVEDIKTTQLPRSWIAYQSVELLVLIDETLESLEPSQAEALKAFANIGGRIILFSGSNTSFSGTSLISQLPPVGTSNSFQSGFKQVLGYQVSKKTKHFIEPRFGSFTLFTDRQTGALAQVFAKSLAPSIPTRETILALLFSFFFVALVLNRLFCTRYLRKPEMTYPLFLVLSVLYFFGVYSFGWQVENKKIIRMEGSFAYIPPTGDKMYVRSIESLISGVAQQISDQKFSKNAFIFPQGTEEQSGPYSSKGFLGSEVNGNFSNTQEGKILSSYLKPNAVVSFGVDRILPKNFKVVANITSFKNDIKSEEEESTHYGSYGYYNEQPNYEREIKLRFQSENISQIEELTKLELVLAFQDRYYLVGSGNAEESEYRTIDASKNIYEITFNESISMKVYQNNYGGQNLGNGLFYIGKIFKNFNTPSYARKKKKKALAAHPLCKLFILDPSQIIPSVEMVGTLDSKTKVMQKNDDYYYNSEKSRLYRNTYIVPVEVPEEYWQND